jgi:hypothetical protein
VSLCFLRWGFYAALLFVVNFKGCVFLVLFWCDTHGLSLVYFFEVNCY